MTTNLELGKQTLAEPIRVAFFDLDGTVINGKGEITSGVRTAVAALKSAGVRLAAATGRPYFAARAAIETLDLGSPGVFFSGGAIVDPADNSVLSARLLDPGQLRQILNVLRAKNIHTELYSLNDFFVESFNELAQIHSECYLKREPVIVESFDGLLADTPIYKVGVTARGDIDCSTLRQSFQQLNQYGTGIGHGASHPDILFGNITHPRASREEAFQFLLQYYNVTQANVLSIGDSEADIAFISRAGAGIAMGNANPVVKQSARFVTRSVEQDGVVFALQQLKLIPEI